MDGQFEQAIARLPRWILLLGLIGTMGAGFFGLNVAGGFLTGVIAAWVNFRIIEKAASRVARLARGEGDKPGRGTGVWVFIQFGFLVLGAFVIITYSGFSMTAAFCGFMVCPAAVVLEILYELVTYDHS